MTQLTPRQLEVLDAIERFIQEKGYPPTLKEIGAAVGLASVNTVHYHLRRLEAAGVLEREYGLHRGLRLVKQNGD